MLDRRTLLQLMGLAAAATALPARAADPARLRLGPARAFDRDALLGQVEAMAARDYAPPADVPDAWKKLTYDQYKAINFKHTAALWRGTTRPFELETFAPGLYFPQPVQIHVVEQGQASKLRFDTDVFTIADTVPDLPNGDEAESLGYSGFRLNAQMDDSPNKSEFCVFQGASYFRSIARGQTYGLSARGLAIDTGDASGEEFPVFRTFYIEKPEPGSERVVVHAVLDSPSVAGLYTFDISPGTPTSMDVDASIFPRRELGHVGIAPQTSMFLFDATNRNRFDDFRAAVHDSDGLLIANGAGERLWRPLANPTQLQVSSFVDNDPVGFGLMQRPRSLAEFGDLEANYHRRPGLWVTPADGWGRGAVTLVEIPADKEIYDNIVAYWRPREPLAAGARHDMRYRLDWCEDVPIAYDGAIVRNTAMGKRIFEDGRVAVVEFAGGAVGDAAPEDFTVHASANRGSVSKGVLQRNPATGGLRLAFTFDPGTARSMELRAQLMLGGRSASEVFLYRWTAA